MVKERTKEFDAEAISHHYDLSNEFYEQFLCENMLYTCAYYREPDGDLAQAQRDKMDSSAGSSGSPPARIISTSAAGGARWRYGRRSTTA